MRDKTPESQASSAAEQRRSEAHGGSSEPRRAQLHDQLRSQSFEQQEATLSPRSQEVSLESPVQMKSVYRAMRGSGQPDTGESATTLGARRQDVTIDTDGNVKREKGKGMSTAPDTPRNLHPNFRPVEFGGKSKNPAWETDSSNLTNETIEWDQDGAKHGSVIPKEDMPFDKYQTGIHATAGSWRKVDKGEFPE